MLPLARRLSAWAAALVVLGGAAPAAAQEGDACVTSYEEAQRLQKRSALVQAKAELRLCLGSCPQVLARDCARWLKALEPKIARLTVEVQRSDGGPLEGARVLVDGVPARRGEDGAVEVDPGAHTPPYHAYLHGSKGDAGRCEGPGGAISGLAFYDSSHSSHGARFPEHFQGGLFYSDFMRGCIWFLPAGEDGLPDPRREEIFSTEASTPVDLQVGPDGSLYYVSIGTGEIHRVRHGSAARGTKE